MKNHLRLCLIFLLVSVIAFSSVFADSRSIQGNNNTNYLSGNRSENDRQCKDASVFEKQNCLSEAQQGDRLCRLLSLNESIYLDQKGRAKINWSDATVKLNECKRIYGEKKDQCRSKFKENKRACKESSKDIPANNTVLDYGIVHWYFTAFSLIGTPPENLKAEEVINSLQNYKCDQLIRYNAGTGLWVTYVKDKPFNNFYLKLGEGYIVRCEMNPNLSLVPYTGDDKPVSIQLMNGWNVIGIPFLKNPISSSILLDHEKIDAVARLDPYTHEWIMNGQFQIYSGMAFAVRTTGSFTLSPEYYLHQDTNCIDIYDPVCGQIQIQCVTVPCDPIEKTFGNMCELGKNPLAVFLYKGECKV